MGVASPHANQSGAQSLQQQQWLVWSAGGAGRVYAFLGTESCSNSQRKVVRKHVDND